MGTATFVTLLPSIIPELAVVAGPLFLLTVNAAVADVATSLILAGVLLPAIFWVLYRPGPIAGGISVVAASVWYLLGRFFVMVFAA